MTIYEAAQLAHVEWKDQFGVVFTVRAIRFDLKDVHFSSQNHFRQQEWFNEVDLGVKIKPILRTLDMMNDVEARVFASHVFQTDPGPCKMEDDGWIDFGEGNIDTTDPNILDSLHPKCYKFLIGQGIDIFGYIKQGIAIKAEK